MNAEGIARLCTERKLTIAVAESCTGGLLGAALTSIPGSSAWFRGGVIAYSNDLKTSLLGVDTQLLARYGAVSAEVAAAMATGALSACGSDIAVSITGVAGPDASEAKPAGLIHLCATNGKREIFTRLDHDAGRAANRETAVAKALEMFAELLRAN